MCALWTNKNSNIDTFNIKAYDIKNDDLFYDGELEI